MIDLDQTGRAREALTASPATAGNTVALKPVSLNGKFLAAHATGVHRVAWHLIREMDQLLDPDDARNWEIIAPRDARAPEGLAHMNSRRAGLFTWQPWEQFDLPRLAQGRLLVNLCNLAPVLTPGVTLIHDAQVFLSPESYSKAFASWYQFALPRIGRSSKRIVTVSNYSREQLVKFGVAPAQKISVVHNGVDHVLDAASQPDIVSRLGLEPGRYVVSLANVQAHKNIGVLFEALRSLPALKLVLMGSDDREAFLRIGKTPPENVVFAGRVSDGEMRGLFEQGLAYACPSRTEGFGLPPLEAMLVGCPAVVAPCGALPEVCDEPALYAGVDAPAEWTAAFSSLLANPAERQNRITAGVKQAGQFTWKRAGRAFLDIVQAARSRSSISA